MTIPIVSPQPTANGDSLTPLPSGGATALNYHPLPGHIGNLTTAQLHSLDKLKEELKDQGYFVKERMSDAMLLRWGPSIFLSFICYFLLLNMVVCISFFFLRFRFLRARKFDLVKAKEMLISAEKWRKDFKVDEIVKFVFPFLANHIYYFKFIDATHRNFEFKEKELVDKYYPQYYHKMDNVRLFIFQVLIVIWKYTYIYLLNLFRKDVRSTLNVSEILIWKRSIRLLQPSANFNV